MISGLRGKLFKLDLSNLQIDVQGVIYEVYIPFKTYDSLKTELGKEIYLHVYHSITDRNQKLYGFLYNKEKELFQLLKSLNGIGEMTSMKLMSFLTVEELYHSVIQNDKTKLEKIPKVREKTSEKIIFEVKQNIKKFESFLDKTEETHPVSIESKNKDMSILALMELGFDEKTAVKEVDKVIKEYALKETPDIVRKVLSLS